MFKIFGPHMDFERLYYGHWRPERGQRLKAVIDDKNFSGWHRYRAVDGFSFSGDCGKASSEGTYHNTDVMELEQAILGKTAARFDKLSHIV